MKPENSDVYQKALDDLPEGHAWLIEDNGRDLILHGLDVDALRMLLAEPHRVGALTQAGRPGGAYFFRYLELVHFPPGSPQFDRLIALHWRWQDLLWNLNLIPRVWKTAAGEFRYGRRLIEETARATGMRARDRFPVVLGSPAIPLDEATMPVGDQAAFAAGFVRPDLPLERVYYLENQPGHLAYRDRAAALKQEEADIARLELETLGRTT